MSESRVAYGVGVGPARHPGGVVGDDAADRAGHVRGRVGAEYAAVATQGGVDAVDGGAWAGRDERAVVRNGDRTEVVARVDDDVGGDGLARQRGSARAERQRAAVGLGGAQEGSDLYGIGRRRHRVGHELVVRRIVRVRIAVDRFGDSLRRTPPGLAGSASPGVMCPHRPDPTLPQRGPIRTARARGSAAAAP